MTSAQLEKGDDQNWSSWSKYQNITKAKISFFLFNRKSIGRIQNPNAILNLSSIIKTNV